MAFIARIRLPLFLRHNNIRLLTTEMGKNNESQQDQNGHNDHDFQDEVLKYKLLNLALKHVNTKGWNCEAIRTGAEELQMSQELGNIFTEYDLVRFFLQKNNDELESHLRENKSTLKEALEWKFERIVPYAPKLNEALAYATQPENLPDSIRKLQNFADIVAHHALQDKSTDLSWYTKRVGIASIYVATELHLLQDKSENYRDTWKFLDNRIKEFGELQQGSILPFANALPEVFSVGVTTALNILGRNQKR